MVLVEKGIKMETSELEKRWMEKKRKELKKNCKAYLLSYVFFVVILGAIVFGDSRLSFLFSDHTSMNVLAILVVALIFHIFHHITTPTISYEVKEDFYLDNKALFYQEKLDVCEFEVIELKVNTNTLSALLKDEQDELKRVDIPLSKVKLECEIGEVRTAVSHKSILKKLPMIEEFRVVIQTLNRHKIQKKWFLR